MKADLQKNVFNVFGVLGILIAFGLFWWFEVRPMEILKKCSEEANKAAARIWDSTSHYGLEGQVNVSDKFYRMKIRECLYRHGIFESP